MTQNAANASFVQPATESLAVTIGKYLACGDERQKAWAKRHYIHLTTEGKATADFAAPWLFVEGGVSNEA